MVKLRASQMNGCAYCVDLHSKDARALGETERRLMLCRCGGEAPFFSDRERAAFAWTESVTLISESGVPDDVYEAATDAVQRAGTRGPDNGYHCD